MGIAYLNKQIMPLAAGALLLCLSLGGCATSTADSSLMDARAEARVSPKTIVYPSIDPLLERERPAMTADERLKLQKELIAARDRQAAAAKARADAARVEAAKP